MPHPTPGLTTLIALLAVSLAGCHADMTAACPTMTALVAASQESVFVPKSAPDPTSLLYTVEITSVKGSCDVDKKLTDSKVGLVIHFRATRAPSGTAASYTVPYFVAVTEGTDRVLAKTKFSAPFSFAPGQATADFSDTVAAIDVKSRGEKKSFDYQVLAGLQLTKEQLAYNRSQGH